MKKDEQTATEIINELAESMAEYLSDKTGAKWAY
jgi:hypothetical protein